jgi:hypothetical protein
MIRRQILKLLNYFSFMHPYPEINAHSARKIRTTRASPPRCRARKTPRVSRHVGSSVAEMWQGRLRREDGWAGDMGKLLQTEIRDSAPSNRNCWRAPLERCRNADEKKDPRVFFICTKGGGVEQDRTRARAVPEILHWRTRPNFLAKFFGKKFWK